MAGPIILSSDYWSATRTGEGDTIVEASPIPNFPCALYPQHKTEPSGKSTQLSAPPADSSVAFAIPEIATGVGESIVVSSPSCPKSLYPQHETVLAPIIAQT